MRTESKPSDDANAQPDQVTPPGFTVSGVQGPGFDSDDDGGVAMLRR